MKYQNLCLLAFSFLFAPLAIQAQTAEEIISKYVEAIGGKDNLSKITSISYENTLEAMGNESPNSRVVLNGKGTKIVSEVMGQKMIQCFTDSSGWMINPMAGSSEPVDMTAEEYNAGKNQIYVTDVLADYTTRGYKVELLPNEKVGTVDAYKIKVESPEKITLNYFIDPSTYYIMKMTMSGKMMGQEVSITNLLSDYRKTEQGLVLPYKIEIDYGGQFSLVINTKKVEFNKTIDPVIFKKGNVNL